MASFTGQAVRRLAAVVAAALAVCAAAAGCDPAADEPSPSTAPSAAVQPAPPETAPPSAHAAAPTTAPARGPVVLVIEGQPVEFPPARLVVETRNDRTVALLMSDDPREAINDDYTGNSYYVEVQFEEEVDTLRDRVWHYQATSAERLDSPTGIFLQGNRRELQPFDLKVHFEHNPRDPNAPAGGEAGDVVWISGTFYEYEAQPVGPGGVPSRPPPPRLVAVSGRIDVAIP